jgi:putative nucleotidyltransferase with HDIG domain
MLSVIAKTLGLKNPYTEKHSENMVNLSVSIGERLGVSVIELENLKYGTLLHDIGKIATPDAILNKPGKLTDEEFDEIKKHPIVGYELLSSVSKEIADIVRHHHEHVDGSGYPDGLQNIKLGIMAKIVAVVDVFDALINVRPYKQAFTKEKALEIIRASAGSHFDKDVVEAFVTLI